VRLFRLLSPPIHDRDEAMKQVRHMLILLAVASFMGFQVWRGIFNNFAVEVAGIDASQMGVIQGVREIPGLLAFLVAALLIVMREQTLAFASVICMGVGVALTGFFPDFAGLLLVTLLMSFGFHYYETVNQSLTLQHIPKKDTPLFLGQMRAYSGVAGVAGLVVVYGLSSVLGYEILLLGAGLLMVTLVLFSIVKFPKVKERVQQRKGIVLRKKYGLFYALTFLSGARRQIFIAFAVFLLVSKHAFTVKEVTLLFLANSLLTIFAGPLIGRLVQRRGERFVVMLEYSGLLFVFMGYTLLDSRWALAGLYLLDHVFFNMSIAIRTYFQKIAEPADLAPSMGVSLTINHIAAVVVPPVGGLLWLIDFRYTFYLGVALAFCSLLVATRIQTPTDLEVPSSNSY
jgi:MFS family permease